MGERLAGLRSLAPARPGSRTALHLTGLAVVAGLAVLAARHVDLREVAGVLARADPLLLLAAGGANLLSLALHSARWASVVRGPALRVRFRDAFSAVVSGFALSLVIPARAGDVARAMLLSRRSGVPVASLLTAAALDYVVGAATLVPLLAALALLGPLPGWARHALLVFAAVAVVGVLLARLLRPPRGRAPERGGGAGLLVRLRAGLAAVHDPRALAASFAWGLAGWAAEVLIALCALAAVGLAPSLWAAGLAVVASTAANVVAVSPGNAGPFEAAVVLALAGAGAPREAALAFALLYHLAHLAPVGLVGGAMLLREARAAGRDAPTGP